MHFFWVVLPPQELTAGIRRSSANRDTCTHMETLHTERSVPGWRFCWLPSSKQYRCLTSLFPFCVTCRAPRWAQRFEDSQSYIRVGCLLAGDPGVQQDTLVLCLKEPPNASKRAGSNLRQTANRWRRSSSQGDKNKPSAMTTRFIPSPSNPTGLWGEKSILHVSPSRENVVLVPSPCKTDLSSLTVRVCCRSEHRLSFHAK